MPKRTNKFQEIVADIHRALAPAGATFEESAMISDQDGTLREVDVLIKTKVAGAEMSLAVECRDYDRAQSIEWVDSLIGKYDGLLVDKVVAVSSSGFSDAAVLKADREGILCISADQAENVDWARKFCEPWKSLHYNMRVFHLAANGPGQKRITHTALDEEWQATHDDALSERVFPVLYRMFWENFKDEAQRGHDEHIAAKWETIPDGRRAYFEVEIKTDFTISGTDEKHDFKGLLAGIGVTYRWEEVQSYSRVCRDHVATNIDLGPASLTIVRAKGGELVASILRVADVQLTIPPKGTVP